MRVIVVVLAVLAALCPEPARACGGCFATSPVGQPTPVTAHRMAFLVSPSGSTLWDQITYSGRPEDFVWVLPTAPGARVELADEGFFGALVATTQITMRGPIPPGPCPDPCGPGLQCGASAAATRAGDPTVGDVRVEYEGVVGPYETATVASTDPGALLRWLEDRGYAVDASILPTLSHYVGLGMSFAALRLRPDAGIQRMQPVRVTVPGLSTLLPLRMVAAGIQDHVALELFVFAEGRMEAASFANAEVDREAIAYDWASQRFDYDERFLDALYSSPDGTSWVTEFAALADDRLGSFEATDPATGATQSAAEDWAVVTAALRRPYLTRLRTDLGVAELDRDLDLRAAPGGDLPAFFQVTRELNRVEPVCARTCASGDGTGPGTTALRGSRCSAGWRGRPGLTFVVLGAALAALAWRRR